MLKNKFYCLTLILISALLLLIAGCTKEEEPVEPEVEETEEVEEVQTGFTTPVPEDYLNPSSSPGRIEKFDYNSKDFLKGETDITKTAYVYLPYNYNPNKTETSYNILYLMHGWYGYAGDFFDAESGTIKNVIDHLIETGQMEPTIIVAPSFYNDSSEQDFTSSKNQIGQFHREFTEYLMPAIESNYNTYAATTSPEDLQNSRDHRAFGGFSMGAVTTWNEFCYDADYIKYFLPMSGSCWYYDDNIDNYASVTSDYFEQMIADKGLNDKGYYIYATTGTDDYQRGKLSELMSEMFSRDDTFPQENIQFYKKESGQHDMVAVREYLYNALPQFFKGNP